MKRKQNKNENDTAEEEKVLKEAAEEAEKDDGSDVESDNQDGGSLG